MMGQVFRLQWPSGSALAYHPGGREFEFRSDRLRQTQDVKVGSDCSLSKSMTFRCVCIYLFDCLSSHEQFFSYLAAVSIAGDRAAN